MTKQKIKLHRIGIVNIALKYARAAKKSATEHTLKRDLITTNAVERFAYIAAEGAIKAYRSALKRAGIK